MSYCSSFIFEAITLDLTTYMLSTLVAHLRRSFLALWMAGCSHRERSYSFDTQPRP